MELAVLNTQGKDTGKKITLSDNIFNVEPNDHALYLDVKSYLANQRQGTHKSKEKHEITGSTRKIKKQKGTGTARAGSIKSPIFKGGARVFGPKPRDYSFKLNKKLKQLARKSALSYKAREASILVLDQINIEKPSTKEYINILKNLSFADTKTLLVLADYNTNVYLSGRNIPKTSIKSVNELCTYDLLNAQKLIFTEDTVKKLEELLA